MRTLLYILLALVIAIGVNAADSQPVATSQNQNTKVEVPERKKADTRDKNKQEVPPPPAKDGKDSKNEEAKAKSDAPKGNNQAAQEEKPRQGKVEKVETEVNMQYDGIDVSRHQKTIDWDVIAADKKVKYVYIKATEGQSFVDPKYRENLENARRVGIKVGSYHFFRTGTSIQDQFNNFVNNVKKNEQDLLPLLDVEVRQGWSNQQMRDSVKLFADMLENHYGCRPMIYTSSSFFNTILGRLFADYPLFIARYAANEPQLENGAKWTLWQFSDRGRMRGIDHAVDLSRFNKGKALRDIMIKENKIGHQKRSNADVVDKSREKPAAINVKKEAPARSKQQEAEIKKKQDKEKKSRERAEKLSREDEKAQEIQQPTDDKTNDVRRAVRQRTKAIPVDPEEARKALEKERKEQEKAAKAEAKAAAAREKAEREKAAREKAAREKAEKEAQKRVDKMVKEEIKRQEREEAEAAKQAREQEKLAREQAAKQAREQAQDAEKQAHEQEKEAERLAKEQEKKAREEAKQRAIAEKRAVVAAQAKAELEKEAQAEAARNAQQQKRQQAKEKRQQQKAASASKSTQPDQTPARKRVNKSTADND